MNKAKGFSLLEAMAVVAILGILSAFAYPSFQSSLASANMRNATATIENALNRARIASIENNKRVSLCPKSSASALTCSTTGADWSHGILVFEDENSNGTFDTSEQFIESFDIDGNVINVGINGSMEFVSFIGGGARAQFSGGTPGTIEITSSRSSGSGKICLKLNNLGRVVVDENCTTETE